MNVFSYGRVDQLPSEEEEDKINLIILLNFSTWVDRWAIPPSSLVLI